MFAEVNKIKLLVAKKWGVSIAALEGPSRTKMLARARQEAMARCRIEAKLSFPEIGYMFGKRHHTTVMWAYRLYIDHPEKF